MNTRDLIQRLAVACDTPFVLTDADLERPGPTILFVNAAFCTMTGYRPDQLVGQSPRILQGAGTKPMPLRALRTALQQGKPFRGVITNYRASGEEYLCEVIAEPLYGLAGTLEGFVAFEREVKRRRGRPRAGLLGRYRAAGA